MKLLVIGAGTVGRHLSRFAAALEPISAVTVADRDLARAGAAAAACGGRAIRLDALDGPALVAAMRQADVVVSVIEPSTRFGLSTLHAAIEAGCRYAEVGDDPHPTLAMLACGARARASGTTAVIGLGASPGISNLLAVEAARRLDQVERIVTGWGAGGAEAAADDPGFAGEVTAALEHWVEQACGPIPILQDGLIVEAPALSPVTVDYPGIGRVVTRSIGHPEPVTLKRRFPELRDSVNVMDFPSYVFASLEQAARRVRAGASPREGAALLLARLSEGAADSLLSAKAARYAWHEAKDRLSGKRWLPPLWALAEGRKDGRPLRVAASLANSVPVGMGPITGAPAAVAVAMLAAGELRVGPGVHAIEEAVPPGPFFERLRPLLEPGVPSAVDLRVAEPSPV